MGTCPVRRRSSVSVLENAPESATPAHQDAVTVSLCDYPAFGRLGLTVRIGERLTVLSDDGDFLIVRSANTGLESYIPTTHTAKVTHTWLFASVSRCKAVELLMLPNNRSGAFLIRESETSAGCYSLSILRRSRSPCLDCVKHYRICCLRNGWVCISPGLTFPSLHHLVEHYSEAADGLCCRLTAPCFIGSSDGESGSAPTTARRPAVDWKDLSRSMIIRRKRTESDNSLVSEGLRETVSSYLQMMEGDQHSWDT